MAGELRSVHDAHVDGRGEHGGARPEGEEGAPPPRTVHLELDVEDAALVRLSLALLHDNAAAAPIARRIAGVWGYVALEIAKADHPTRRRS